MSQRRIVILVASLSFGLGCGDELDATSQAWCERAESCGVLNTSTDECATASLRWIDVNIQDGLRDDCDEALKGCLDRSACQSYLRCSFDPDSVAFFCHPFELRQGG